ncbi:MAG: hypothetical protein R2771_05445 [Saprospiraceae bacterium]
MKYKSDSDIFLTTGKYKELSDRKKSKSQLFRSHNELLITWSDLYKATDSNLFFLEIIFVGMGPSKISLYGGGINTYFKVGEDGRIVEITFVDGGTS